MMVMNIADSLKLGTRMLSVHSDSPRLDAELLLAKVLGLSRAALIAHDDAALAADRIRAYADMIARRTAGAPVAYLTGTREFWSLNLRVSPAVLVPRPETEVLVEQALNLKLRDEPCAVLDLGTGSGAVALAIAAERGGWKVTGTDLSPQALGLARENAQVLHLSNVDWCAGSWFDAVPARRFDLIVSNPPYVASGDPALAALSAEPALALDAGPTGLEALDAIISQSAAHLHERGWLLLEHARDQAPAVAAMLARQGFTGIRNVADLSGCPRVTLATLHTQQ
jgi:release factor glutamine methyltransferase